jgi:hypothetical protein
VKLPLFPTLSPRLSEFNAAHYSHTRDCRVQDLSRFCWGVAQGEVRGTSQSEFWTQAHPLQTGHDL